LKGEARALPQGERRVVHQFTLFKMATVACHAF
jgi:hypothetical protein